MGSPGIIEFGVWIRIHDDALVASWGVGKIEFLDIKGVGHGSQHERPALT
jgi:hypothetical protein